MDNIISNSTNVMYIVITSLLKLNGEKEIFAPFSKKEATATVNGALRVHRYQ